MEPRELLSLVARQLESARQEVDREERRGETARLSRAVFRSLRITYLALSTGLDPGTDAGQAFILECAPDGSLLLRQGAHPVPVDEATLAHLFLPVDVLLTPGQSLLLEPDLVKHVIEDALAGMARDRDEREERKIDLVTARLVAEELLDRARALSSPVPADAEVSVVGGESC
jgi:hypothetical protein